MKAYLQILFFWTTLILFFGTKQVSAQDSSLRYVKSYYYEGIDYFYDHDSYYYGLTQFYPLQHKKHIRIHANRQIIDFFSEDGKVFHGKIVNALTEIRYIEENEFGKINTEETFISQTLLIDSVLSTKIAEKILGFGLDTIPYNSFSKSKLSTCFCPSITFEFNINKKMKVFDVLCPWAQSDSIVYKKSVIDCYDYLKSELKLDSLYQDFERVVPFPLGVSHMRSALGSTRAIPIKNKVCWTKRKARRYEFLKTMRDSIYDYLELELDKYFPKNENTFLIYTAKLGKSGNLAKIKTNNTPSLKFGISNFISDLKKRRKERHILKKAFKKVNLKHFDIQFPIEMQINLSYGAVNIWSNGHYF